jgi:hypothetical protein
MRVVILSTWDNRGGAARAANNLHQGIRAAGHDSAMLVANKASEDPAAHVLDWMPDENGVKQLATREKFQTYLYEARTPLTNTYYSADNPSFGLSSHPLVRRADVISVHWIAGFQSAATIAQLQRSRNPVVRTLHDQRPMTVGCHFSAGCQEYQRACSPCVQLQEDAHVLPATDLANQISAFWKRGLTIVSPSQWLADCAQCSTAFSGRRVNVIPYGINTDIFKPQPKHAKIRGRYAPEHNREQLRKRYGLYRIPHHAAYGKS